MKLFKLLGTALTLTANTMTVAGFAFILYVILGGVITAGREPAPTCVYVGHNPTCILR